MSSIGIGMFQKYLIEEHRKLGEYLIKSMNLYYDAWTEKKIGIKVCGKLRKTRGLEEKLISLGPKIPNLIYSYSKLPPYDFISNQCCQVFKLGCKQNFGTKIWKLFFFKNVDCGACCVHFLRYLLYFFGDTWSSVIFSSIVI